MNKARIILLLLAAITTILSAAPGVRPPVAKPSRPIPNTSRPPVNTSRSPVDPYGPSVEPRRPLREDAWGNSGRDNSWNRLKSFRVEETFLNGLERGFSQPDSLDRIPNLLQQGKQAAREQIKLIEKRSKASAEWTGVSHLGTAIVLADNSSDKPERVLLDFFNFLTGGEGDEFRPLVDSLAKFGSTISRAFCRDFLDSEASSWLQLISFTEGFVLREPTAENLVQERLHLKTRLAEYAKQCCIGWPIEVWSNDQRLKANPDKVQLYPGRIIVKQMGDFKIMRNRFPRAHLVLRHSKDPAKGLASLSVVPNSLQVIFDAPKTLADAVRMYDDAQLPLSWAHQSKYFGSSLAKLGGYSLSKLRPDAKNEKSTIASLILQAVETKRQDEVLVLVTHCDNGILRFSDGSRLPVSAIRQGNALESPIIIMACDTLTHFGDAPGLRFATAKSISYDEAIANTKAIKDVVEQQKPIGEAFRNLQMDELEKNRFVPNPANPSATGQATIQLVETTNDGVITIHSETMAIALLQTEMELQLARY